MKEDHPAAENKNGSKKEKTRKRHPAKTKRPSAPILDVPISTQTATSCDNPKEKYPVPPPSQAVTKHGPLSHGRTARLCV